jgi:hypothetical protein
MAATPAPISLALFPCATQSQQMIRLTPAKVPVKAKNQK